MKKANIDRDILHIFSTTWGISVKFSGKVWLMMILKATKKPEFHYLFRRYIFWKNTRWGRGFKLNPPVVLVLIEKCKKLIKRENKKIINIVGNQGEFLQKFKEIDDFFCRVDLTRSNIYFKICLHKL